MKNNKGYVLLEIILASVIALSIAYFVMDLTIKLKNKNDDLLVKTQVYTDQAIIYNSIMKSVYDQTFDCDKMIIDSSNKKFTYDGFTNILSNYVTTFSKETCTVNNGEYQIKINLGVKQLPNENFNIDICYGSNCYN